MTSEDADLFAKLAEVQATYEETLTIATLAAASRTLSCEPPRNIYYPLDLALAPTAILALAE
jgi:hypothetical protein